MLQVFKDFLMFLAKRKKYWLIPVVLVLFIFGYLVIFTSGAVVAPFIYTLF